MLYVSAETIYRTLFVQARGALKRELLAHLRSRRLMRRGRHASTRRQPRGQIKEAIRSTLKATNDLRGALVEIQGNLGEGWRTPIHRA